MPRRIFLDELVEDVAAKWSSAKDGEYFQGDDGWVGEAPAEVSTSIFFPYRQCKLISTSSANGPSLVFT